MPLLGPEVVERLRHLFDRRPQPVEEPPAGIGEGDAPGRAMQQSNPETLLEVPHRVAERRGGAAEARGRRPEAEIVGDGNERRQIGKVGATHC